MHFTNCIALGDGKTHYIKKELAKGWHDLTMALSINECFDPVEIIRLLRNVPLEQRNLALFLNFSLPKPAEVYRYCMQTCHSQLRYTACRHAGVVIASSLAVNFHNETNGKAKIKACYLLHGESCACCENTWHDYRFSVQELNCIVLL